MENLLFCYSYTDFLRELTALKKQYRSRMKIVSAGFSADGRMIPEVIIGDLKAPVHILIQAGIHGREYMNCAVVMRQMREYLDSIASAGSGMEKALCYHVMPMTNPDGCMISQFGPAGIRNEILRERVLQISGWTEDTQEEYQKKRTFFQSWKSNARGVDLNRNFLPDWEAAGESEKAGFQGYKGPSACSEPEVKAILGIQKKYSVDCCISFHSSGEAIYWDYERESTGKGVRDDQNRRERQLACLLSKSTSYPMISVKKNRLPAAGCSDHFARIFNALAITVETGKGECPLAPDEYEIIWEQNRNLWNEIGQFCKKTVDEIQRQRYT